MRYALVLLLAGCTVLGSKPVTVGCQVADTVSTVQVIKAGGYEAGLLHGASAGMMIAVGVIWLAIKLYYADQWSDETKTALNVIACTAGAHNISVYRGM